jgi:hypothetical protein
VTLLALVLASASEPLPVLDLALSIEEDRGFSGDHSTLCLVRVVNRGRSTLAGGDIGFEARAIREGRVAARQRGRFGLTLGPHETLETKVAFLGRFDRFEVVLAEGDGRGSGGRKSGKSGKSGKSRKSGKGPEGRKGSKRSKVKARPGRPLQ